MARHPEWFERLDAITEVVRQSGGLEWIGRKEMKVIFCCSERDSIRLLHKFGYDCDVASNGQQALRMLAGAEYPLVLMDCQMPAMDGFQATATIREREGEGRRTPIVGLTAHALHGDRERCLSAGMDDYVTKPIDEKVLLRALEHWAPGAQGRGSESDRIRILAPPAMADLIPDYLDNCRQNLTDLANAVERGDLRTVRTIGHSLKGCGQGYGFPAITEIGRDLEYAAAEQHVEGVGKEISRLKEYLSRLEVVYP